MTNQEIDTSEHEENANATKVDWSNGPYDTTVSLVVSGEHAANVMDVASHLSDVVEVEQTRMNMSNDD